VAFWATWFYGSLTVCPPAHSHIADAKPCAVPRMISEVEII